MKEKNYEKIQLFDAIAEAQAGKANGYTIYSDYFGLLTRFDVLIVLSVTAHGGEEFNSNNVYFKQGEDLNFKDIAEIFSKKLYKNSACSEEISIYEVEICLGTRNRSYYGNYSVSGRNFKFTADTIGKLNHVVWKIPDSYSERRANTSLLKAGDLVYINNIGTHRITEVLEPNRENKLFNAEYIYSNTPFEIRANDRDEVYQVPYLEYPNELAQFNEFLNENALRPFVVRDGNDYSVYWLPIEDAMQYTVSLYKLMDVNGEKLYHLKDICVDRNTRYLTVENLFGNNFIFRVTAENRAGEIVAKSRGISENGSPKFW